MRTIERMTSRAVRAAVDGGSTTVVIACGAVEQHGPHLPLFMDAEHGVRLAEEVAARLGNALVAPTIRVGCSEHHMAFAGSMTLRVETFEAVCADYVASLARHGFSDVCFVPTHGGNYGPLAAMLPRLNDLVSPHARVHAFTDLHGQVELWRRVIEAEAGLGDRVGGHADIAEASIMLALHPELVDVDAAEPGYLGELTPAVLARLFERGIGAVTPNGVLGDPRGMTAALGLRCIAETADLIADTFREAIAAPRAG
jgi:creatinine amidohydrolase